MSLRNGLVLIALQHDDFDITTTLHQSPQCLEMCEFCRRKKYGDCLFICRKEKDIIIMGTSLELLSTTATRYYILGVKVGTEIPSSSTLIFSDRIFEYSSILHLLKIAHQGP